MNSYTFDDTIVRSIKSNLRSFEPQLVDDPDLQQAAVAIVITANPATNQTCILLTLRPSKLNRHGGQYALPGGRLDEGESDEEAALRELHEELGLELESNCILQRLDDFPTRSGFRIAPFVMLAPADADLRPDPNEVEKVFYLPLEELNNPDIPRLTESENSDHPVLSAFFPTLGHYMYAPTAAILYQFREVALRGTTTRVAHFDQPAFAWK